MTRKRGKSRKSSATKRALRWKQKYVVDALTKRPKILLPSWYLYLREAEINWDYLETLLFPEFEACGVPIADYAYYMAWAKQKGAIGLTFRDTTRTEEHDVLKQVFVRRGLDPDIMDCLEPTVDKWLEEMLPEFSLNLIVDSFFNNANTCRIWAGAWQTFGSYPYIEDDNPLIDYIVNKDGGYGMCRAGFTSLPSGAVKIVSVKLHVKHLVNSGWAYILCCYKGEGDPDLLASWETLANVTFTNGWRTDVYDVSAILDTVSKVNNALVGFAHDYSSGTGILVAHAWLEIVYKGYS